MKVFWPLTLVLLLATGCSSMSSYLETGVNISNYKHLYVEHKLADARGVDTLIAQDFRNRGYDISYGPLTLMPRQTDAIISYDDRWDWDFTYYLLQLTVTIRDARTGRTVANVKDIRPSISGKTPVQMIHESVSKILKR